jgi:transposase
MAEWRTLQMFLSSRGVFEVELNMSTSSTRCTCPGYATRKYCKHTRWVESRMKTNGGTYPMSISTRAPAVEATRANKSPAAFRDFVVKYGKIEVV